jgi:hypothetical protein
MPKVTFVKSARKANPVAEVGQSYYWWKFRFGGKRYSKKMPRPSQLTQSEYLSTLRSLIEQVEDHNVGDPEAFEELRDEIVSAVTDLREQAQDSLDNMPESLQASPTGELLQERIDALESAESDIENLEVDDIDESDFDDRDAYDAAIEERIQLMESHISEMIDYLSNADI